MRWWYGWVIGWRRELDTEEGSGGEEGRRGGGGGGWWGGVGGGRGGGGGRGEGGGGVWESWVDLQGGSFPPTLEPCLPSCPPSFGDPKTVLLKTNCHYFLKLLKTLN